MRKTTLAIIVALATTITAFSQVLTNSTARYYLPAAESFTQSQVDSFNALNLYMTDIVNGAALSYPDMIPIQLTWNGSSWTAPSPTPITTSFNTNLMVGALSHTSSASAGATAPVVNIDWADVPGVTQYRFRIRPIGGTWNPSTITGSQRSLTTLAYSTIYECQVRVYLSASIQGEYCQTYTFVTPSFTPLPTCNQPIVTAQQTSDSIFLSWQPVAQGVGYQVEIRELDGITWGGTTITGTSFKFKSTGKAYEYRIRTNCIGASTQWSQFSILDTATSAVCTAPSGLSATGKTLTWIAHPYDINNHIEIRRIGTVSWGGASTTANSITFNTLTAGTYEWRIRSRCHSTTNTGWTAFSPIQLHTIIAPSMFEPIVSDAVYPNPANNEINLPGEFVIRDLTGRAVLTGKDYVDVSHLSNGIYIINGQRLMIQH